MQVVILAGGKGTRLKPFTTNFPKPLVPIANQPILEIILRQLKHAGCTEIILAVNHLAELIESYFGNGEKIGVQLTYSKETQELGTAGPLGLIPNLQEDFLVMNGDTLTTLQYKDLFRFHSDQKNDATIATYQKEVHIDLGVLHTAEGLLEEYKEKPTMSFTVSMGVNVLNRKLLGYLPKGKRMDMPDLLLTAKRAGERIGCYFGSYYWLDIGRTEDYETAIEIFTKRQKEFLPDV
ncbi:MAG: NTP transferase domain-containing protein [Candidatus Kerfeldbacteria bacterium]|nr:NTP transferase domain-containing protein [Candidatus Kerfeldbacteria bacterium]